jgi:hypothetical protein
MLQDGTMKFIWSMGQSDEVAYHGSNRGARAVNILDAPRPPIDFEKYENLMKL